MVLWTSSQCASLGVGLSALTLGVLFSAHAGPQVFGIKYLPPAGSFRFEAPGAEQVGIVTGLLEGRVLCFIPLCGPKFLFLSGPRFTHLQMGVNINCYYLTTLST